MSENIKDFDMLKEYHIQIKGIKNRIKHGIKRYEITLNKMSKYQREYLLKEISTGNTIKTVYNELHTDNNFYLTLFDFSRDFIKTMYGFYLFRDKVYKLTYHIADNLLNDIVLSFNDIKEYAKNINSDNIKNY